jgi:uncharacterized membrane protein YbaN (DUF454 family)
MNEKHKHIIILCLGWVFIALGIAGLFLPFLQGIFFLLVGLYLVSVQSHWAKRLLDKISSKHPALKHTIEGARKKGNHWINCCFKKKRCK